MVETPDVRPRFWQFIGDPNELEERMIGIGADVDVKTGKRSLYFRPVGGSPYLVAMIDGTLLSKNNLNASVAPTVDDDIDAGYDYGSLWLDIVTNVFRVCKDPAPGAAVWEFTGGVTSHEDLVNKNSETDVKHVTDAQLLQIGTNATGVSDNANNVAALQSGITNYQLVTTATADIAATTSIVGIDCDTIGAACTLTALTAGLIAGREITVIAFGTDINTVSVVGEGGEYFNETETSVEITNDNRTLVLSVVNGGYNVVNPADSQSIWENHIEELGDTESADSTTILTNNKTLKRKKFQNGIVNSTDISQSTWTKTGIYGLDGDGGVIGSSVSGSQRLIGSFVSTAGDNTVVLVVEKGVADWLRILIGSYLSFVDLKNLCAGATNTLDDVVLYEKNGNIYIKMSKSLASGTQTFAVYLADDDNDYLTYTGNDADVDVRFVKCWQYDGTIRDNVGCVDGGASVVPQYTKYVHDVDSDELESNGFIQSIDATDAVSGWTATPVDGELYRPRGSNDYELLQYIDGNATGQEDSFYWKFRYVTTAAAGTASGSVSIDSPVVLEEDTSMLLNVSVMAVFRDRQGIIVHNFTVVRGYDSAEMGPETESFNTIEGLAGVDSAGVSMAFTPGVPTGTVNVDFTHENVSASTESVIEWWVEIKGPKFTDVSEYC